MVQRCAPAQGWRFSSSSTNDVAGHRIRIGVAAADLTVPDKSPVLAALGAGLILAIAGSKTRGTKRRRTYTFARCVIARTTGKTSIRGSTGKASPNAVGVTGVRGCCLGHRDQKQSAQDPLHQRPPRLIQSNAIIRYYGANATRILSGLPHVSRKGDRHARKTNQRPLHPTGHQHP
jgi:hypothetical protein